MSCPIDRVASAIHHSAAQMTMHAGISAFIACIENEIVGGGRRAVTLLSGSRVERASIVDRLRALSELRRDPAMPFIAKRNGTGERIDITLIENPRAVLKRGECLCQVCDTQMIVKAGLVRQHHFAHVGRCPSDYQAHPESPAHQDAKRFLAANLREQFREYANTTIEYEVPVPEVKRIADLLVTFPTGCSSMLAVCAWHASSMKTRL
jgi:Competence protein CoiA-like family